MTSDPLISDRVKEAVKADSEAAAFILTIDTEEDNAWEQSVSITTENAKNIPRFQSLCDEFGLKPTYLVTYQMATDPYFCDFGFKILAAGSGELGLHVHPWNSPPIDERFDLFPHHHYLYELPPALMRSKMEYLDQVLQDTFAITPVSHRAGRWGFNEQVAKALNELEYRVDCSVTPGVSWKHSLGMPGGPGGPSFSGFEQAPYFLDLEDVSRPGASRILEVPVTIKPNPGRLKRASEWMTQRIPLAGRAMTRFVGATHTWLRPNGRNGRELIEVVDWAVESRLPVIEFMLHSSELMAGGNPTFRTEQDIERLFADMRALFRHALDIGLRPMTLAKYRTTVAEVTDGE